jgi:uncharacterized protein
MDCFVAFSACPQDIVNIQGSGDNTPKDVDLVLLGRVASQRTVRGPWVPPRTGGNAPTRDSI